MKKVFLTALIAVSLSTSVFATEKTKVNVLIRNSFNSEFRDAKDVEWNSNKSYVMASFISGKKRMHAFYDFNGSLLGTSHAVSLESLPTRAKRALAKKYSDYTVEEAIKFEKSDETAFFISASKNNSSVIFKIVDGQVSLFR